MEFKSFNKILHIAKLTMSITQKIHGTNSQILIEKSDSDSEWNIQAGSRNRFLGFDKEDNFGFCKWVHENKSELVEKLGEGRHFGEWCGSGINSGEGLKDKLFVLFNWRRWKDKELPIGCTTVPVLYDGKISLDAITSCMEKLKTEGSFLVPGYMKPEGIVIELDGQFYKNVFENEEIQWKEKLKTFPSNKNDVDISYLLQPLRLKKLLSRDESYIINYPSSLGKICKDYVKDLEKEGQFKSDNPDVLKDEKKELGRTIFFFVKSIVNAL